MRLSRAGEVALGLSGLAFLIVLVLMFLHFTDPYRLPSRDWWRFKKKFISGGGRVIDTGNGMISHSEGQGYGMLFAVAYRDRKTFDRIWLWTKKNMQTRPEDKLLSWSWQPEGKDGGRVNDPNNASDGDLLVAWALYQAFILWGDQSYQKEALQILSDLARLDVTETPRGKVLLPGTVGFDKEEGITLNPSYYVFPALDELGEAIPSGPWKELRDNGLELLKEARFGHWDLTPDWVLEGESIAIAPNFPPVFGYNAVRIPLYLGWYEKRNASMQPFAHFWRECRQKNQFPATVDLKTNAFGPDPALPGMRAVARFTLACTEKQSLTVHVLPVLTGDEPYYSASLNLLTKIAIRDAFARK